MNRRGTKRLLGLAVGLVGGLSAGQSHAYVREVTSAGVAIAWRNPCVTLHANLDAPVPMLSAADLVAGTQQAMAAWSYPQVACTDVRLLLVAEPGASLGSGYDKRNIIAFRQNTWCREPTPINDAGIPQPDCYPASALAVTSIFKNVKTGEILDTDIEFNAVHYAWGDLVGQPSLATSTTADFPNALTHELGHVVGLDHNCFTPSDGPTRLKDDTGAPAVDCYGNPELPDTVADATMYPSVTLSDTERRSLSPDDLLGLCDIYPHAHEICPAPASDGGCSALHAGRSARHWPEVLGSALALLLACLILRRARRRT